MTLWQPGISVQRLRDRAQLMREIRDFFAQREVMEVDTPLLATAGVTDPHLTNAETSIAGQRYFLQTSPEYAMKRLLAAGSGCIYQLGKAVRDDELGRYHNPEFCLLEWYRIGFDDTQLMQEVDAFLQVTLGCEAADYISYQALFLHYLNIDPLEAAGITQLKHWLSAQQLGDWVATETDTDTLLQLAMSHFIEPQMGQQRPVIVFNFPASQAALARIDVQDPRVARRFEVYFKGIELANGFYELSDSSVQAQRFAADNQMRSRQGKPQQPIDHHLLAALEAGLPDCAGVALGVDRLAMLRWGAEHIDQVLSFSARRV
ncbi:MAG: elongation factor P--(R)-beta-lysine ligase [Firmicutes bacterium]|nr:elongation factor P--(R)-beta-lysine ligase [Bacillota bacterium]